MARYHRDFTEGHVRMAMEERRQHALLILEAANRFEHDSPEQNAAYRVAARLYGPIVTRESDPLPGASWLEVQSWD